jgi:site-specific DNA-methyltransferase (adenine-specific)
MSYGAKGRKGEENRRFTFLHPSLGCIGSGGGRVTNILYYGDNLEVLREHIADESVDLIYLDPPFNSNAGYNVLFKSASGAGADASIEAFDDTWTWGDSAKEALMDIAKGTNRPLQVMMSAMHDALDDSPLMAYLAMMAVRLVELHRVLKDTGSLYLHCDPTASHYLKLVLDAVFGAENFRSEIIWKRTSGRSDAKRFGNVHDTIFFYSKSGNYVWNQEYQPYDADYVEQYYRFKDENGRRFMSGDLGAAGLQGGGYEYEYKGVTRLWRLPLASMEKLDAEGKIYFTKNGIPRHKRYLDEAKGMPVQDTITDIEPLRSWHQERLHYPTQKPRALLERIIAASSNPGDTVLDPFCGCGTAVDAAQKLGRQWIGIDITHIAIGMIEDRMRSGYPGIEFETHGVPKDLDSAIKLANDDKHQFQQWACWHVGGYPREKKGGDKGVDGWFNYLAEGGKIETGVISVKGGENLNPGMVRDLGRVMERDKHRFGLFVTAAMPTKGVRDEIASHPLIETEFGRFPAMQVVTIAELIHGPKPKLPPLISPVKKASRVETRASHQKGSQGELL